MFFFFFTVFFSFNYEYKKIKKIKKVTLTAASNLGLTEYYIDKNWKLGDWNDKTKS